MPRSHLERVIPRGKHRLDLPVHDAAQLLKGTHYPVDDAIYEVTRVQVRAMDTKNPERDQLLLHLKLITCDYCEPADSAKWRGTDKTARNTRHAKPEKYACGTCAHWLSNPVRIDSVPVQEQSTQEQPKQAGLL